MSRKMLLGFNLLLTTLTGVSLGQSLVLDLPDQSQSAQITQRIGITDITIRYHRPCGERPKGLGRAGSVRASVARGREHQYRDLVQRSGHD
jgi:hypothetical protein